MRYWRKKKENESNKRIILAKYEIALFSEDIEYHIFVLKTKHEKRNFQKILISFIQIKSVYLSENANTFTR